MKISIKKILPKRIGSVLRRMSWSALNIESTTASGLKLKIKNPGDWYVFNEIFVRGVYDEAIKQAFEKSPQNHNLNILDVGANVGFFTLRILDLSQQSGRGDLTFSVYAVEGNPRIYKQLQRQISLTPKSNFSANPIFGLVGQRAGSGIINQSEFGPQSSIVQTNKGITATVPYVNLDLLTDSLPEIDLLKCDIEGAEELFIENYLQLLTRTKIAVFELHDRLCNTPRCLDLLINTGFHLQKNLEGGDHTSMALFVR